MQSPSRRTIAVAALIGVVLTLLNGCDRGPHYLDPPAMPTEVRAAVDEAVLPLVNTWRSVGLVVGVLHENQRYVLGYGLTRFPGGKSPQGDTLFEIGSVTKTCTGLLLAIMAEAGMAGLDDPAQDYVRGGAEIPAFQGHHITLRHLAMHTSGLPRLPDDLFTGAGFKPSNPYAHYTTRGILDFLSGHALSRRPGAEYEYSNLGAALLGNLLADIEGKSYEEAFRAHIAHPLEMDDTRIALHDTQRARLARGHTSLIRLAGFSLPFPAANWDLPAFAGAGALRSSAEDMLRYLDAAMADRETPLRHAFQASMAPGFTIDARMRVGLGWHVMTPKDGGEPLIWHNGATGGYTSFIGCLPEAGVGVVILNNSTANVDQAALRILGALTARDFLGR